MEATVRVEGRMRRKSLLLVAATLLLPALLFSLLHRLLLGNSKSKRLASIRAVLLLIATPILLSAIFALPDEDDPTKHSEELKLKFAQLGSTFEENSKILNAKIRHIVESRNLLEEMDLKFQALQTELHKIKKSQNRLISSEDIVDSMAEKVRSLWEKLRENNFDIHNLESKALEADDKSETLALEIEKMESIISEQWIQVRQLEHALQMSKMMTLKIQKKHKHSECTFMKFVKGALRRNVPEKVNLQDSFLVGIPNSTSWIHQALDYLKSVLSTATRTHHELQYSVKQLMERYQFTAAIANEEVVFLLASVVIVLPAMLAWSFCSSYL